MHQLSAKNNIPENASCGRHSSLFVFILRNSFASVRGSIGLPRQNPVDDFNCHSSISKNSAYITMTTAPAAPTMKAIIIMCVYTNSTRTPCSSFAEQDMRTNSAKTAQNQSGSGYTRRYPARRMHGVHNLATERHASSRRPTWGFDWSPRWAPARWVFYGRPPDNYDRRFRFKTSRATLQWVSATDTLRPVDQSPGSNYDPIVSYRRARPGDVINYARRRILLKAVGLTVGCRLHVVCRTTVTDC